MSRLFYVVFLSILLFGCHDIFVDQPQNNPVAIYDNLWQTFREEYAPFEERGVDWQDAYAMYKNNLNSHSSEDDLFEAMSSLLEILDDGHVTLTAPNKNVFISNRIRRERIDDELFDLDVIQSNYLELDQKEGEEKSFVSGKIKNEEISYVYLDYVGDNFSALERLIDQYPNHNGLIIDLRHNQGGDFTYAFSSFGRLTDQTRFVFKSKTKNGKGENDYTPWHDWYLRPSGTYFGKPIVVLTDRYTISAGERAVMALMTLPNTIIIGETTNGAHGTMIGRELANGWFFSLVPQKVLLFDGQSYEGIGLAPDVFIKNDLSAIKSGKDQVLEEAIRVINSLEIN